MQMELTHIGINIKEAEEQEKAVTFFKNILGMRMQEGKSNIFIDSCVELMKENGLGEKGHIAFAVDNLKAAISELENRGAVFDYEHFKYDEYGEISAAYLAGEVAGFAIHLIEKKRG